MIANAKVAGHVLRIGEYYSEYMAKEIREYIEKLECGSEQQVLYILRQIARMSL